VALGESVTLEQLDRYPHAVHAMLRAAEPVSWIPVLDAWLVTRHDLALEVMRDPDAYTVDDPRFSTARVVGPSMLSLDGGEHARHREAFAASFRPGAVRERFAEGIREQADHLIDRLAPAGEAELRRAFAGPLATSIIAGALGIPAEDAPTVLRWYDAIVAGVTEISAGAIVPETALEAAAALRSRLRRALDEAPTSLLAAAAHALDAEQLLANAAVLMFGGIETTEGMIANVLLHLLERPHVLEHVRRNPRLVDAAIEESLRLEPAAAVVDRYATAAVALGGAQIARRDLVRVSIAAANRDPTVFSDPDRFELGRPGGRRHLAFAHGPHVCLGIHLARLEARAAVARLIDRLPGLRLDPADPPAVCGLVFRKPVTLRVLWDVEAARL
jgi:cytochrome P450